MTGVDFHIPWVPGTPAPAPSPVPYATFSIMLGLGLQCSKADDHISDSWGLSMLKGTDIGMLIPHIGTPSNTLPIEILGSSSKSHFATSRYMSKGKPVACALLVIMNLNLNCGTPVPTPTGRVLALTTHMVEMSLADFVAGVVSMLMDAALQTALNWAGGKVGSLIGKGLSKLFAPCFALEGAMRAVGAVSDEAFAHYSQYFAQRYAAEVIGAGASTVINFLVGGPMGLDAGTIGLYGTDAQGNPRPTPGGALSDWATGTNEQAASSLLNGPGVAQPPQALPGSPGTNAP